MSATVLHFPTRQRERASAVDSLKLLKAELRKAFPAVKFSTRLHRGTAYGYASVSWTDGPSTKMVDAIVGPFEGSHFNGMIDLEEYTQSVMPDGRETGLRSISTERTISPAFARRLLAQVATYYGAPAPELVESISKWDGQPHWELKDCNAMIQGEWWTTHMHRAAADATRYTFKSEG